MQLWNGWLPQSSYHVTVTSQSLYTVAIIGDKGKSTIVYMYILILIVTTKLNKLE